MRSQRIKFSGTPKPTQTENVGARVSGPTLKMKKKEYQAPNLPSFLDDMTHSLHQHCSDINVQMGHFVKIQILVQILS